MRDRDGGGGYPLYSIYDTYRGYGYPNTPTQGVSTRRVWGTPLPLLLLVSKRGRDSHRFTCNYRVTTYPYWVRVVAGEPVSVRYHIHTPIGGLYTYYQDRYRMNMVPAIHYTPYQSG